MDGEAKRPLQKICVPLSTEGIYERSICFIEENTELSEKIPKRRMETRILIIGYKRG